MARLATFSYWTNTYYGGAVAVLGGALILGALPRIKRQQRIRDALLMGLGLALLANTRPYESLFFCLPIAAVLLIWMFGRSAPPLLLSLRRVLLPLSLVLAITVGAMGYYFWRVTGSPIRIPYQVNISAYHLVYFPWQKLQPAALYRHAVMKQFYQGPPVLDSYGQVHRHPLLWILLKPLPLVIFFLGPVLLPHENHEPQYSFFALGLRLHDDWTHVAHLSSNGTLRRADDRRSLCPRAAINAIRAALEMGREAVRSFFSPRGACDLPRVTASACGGISSAYSSSCDDYSYLVLRGSA